MGRVPEFSDDGLMRSEPLIKSNNKTQSEIRIVTRQICRKSVDRSGRGALVPMSLCGARHNPCSDEI
jgi:hypothetical protein